jgi:hypothetical protein
MGDHKREVGRLWDPQESQKEGGRLQGTVRLTREFYPLRSSSTLLKILPTPSNNVYIKFKSSGTSIGVSVDGSDRGEGEND